jgi:CubicO group peptidase (beta-lactamase class C family)
LLTHRAGLPENGPWAALGFDKGTTEQRAKLIDVMLRRPPATRPATKYQYSNVGYAIAAAMGEQVEKAAWETMIRTDLFEPLGMASAGFGPPGAPGKLDQPWGHRRLGKLSIPMQVDNPPVMGPSGRVHCSIRDWAKFVSLHLRGARGEATPLLSPESFQRLHTPPAGEDYAFGWAVTDRPWAGGSVLTHGGSNTMWLCVVWIAPKKNFAVMAVTNVGGDDAARGCDDACGAMIKHYLESRRATTLPTTRPVG